MKYIYAGKATFTTYEAVNGPEIAILCGPSAKIQPGGIGISQMQSRPQGATSSGLFAFVQRFLCGGPPLDPWRPKIP